ncbi:MAG: HEAT repeat domain-containing protein, partial [Pleurocapsa sp. MO_226.B13]|nr:HEAT repeat domain-containing protein [Pleurocapsa sp. MO_226.B13]
MKLSSQEMANKKDISLFQLACDFGWLNLVDRDMENEEEVYAFYHPTFQEYFAAKAIDDWHFFLNHIPKNPSQGTYRIFEPQWKEPMLLWLGRPEDKLRQQKESFIKALVDFEDGCGEWLSQAQVDKGFYEYQAYFLAAAGIAEFRDCSRADEIVEQIVKWDIGYLDEKGERQKFLYLIQKGAQEALQETERTRAIAALVKLLGSTEDEYTRIRAAESLVNIGTGNERAIARLVELLGSTQDADTRWQAAKSLGKIDPGNETAITALVELLKPTAFEQLCWSTQDEDDEDTDEQVLERLHESLREIIEPGNQTAIAALEKLLGSTQDDPWPWTRIRAAESLVNIGTGNETVIAALVELLDSTEYEDILFRAADSLEKIGTGNQTAIAGLVKLLVSTEYDNPYYTAKHCLK